MLIVLLLLIQGHFLFKYIIENNIFNNHKPMTFLVGMFLKFLTSLLYYRIYFIIYYNIEVFEFSLHLINIAKYCA